MYVHFSKCVLCDNLKSLLKVCFGRLWASSSLSLSFPLFLSPYLPREREREGEGGRERERVDMLLPEKYLINEYIFLTQKRKQASKTCCWWWWSYSILFILPSIRLLSYLFTGEKIGWLTNYRKMGLFPLLGTNYFQGTIRGKVGNLFGIFPFSRCF